MNIKILLIIALFSFMVNSCGLTNPDNETSARVMVWKFVENNLKDPASAEFGPCRMKKIELGSWVTDSYVDAKNSFGGTQRLKFHCEVKYNSDETWQLIDLKFK